MENIYGIYIPLHFIFIFYLRLPLACVPGEDSAGPGGERGEPNRGAEPRLSKLKV